MTYWGGGGLKKLKHQKGITLATINNDTWQSVITAILDIHDKNIPILKTNRWDKSLGYKSLAPVVKYLTIENSQKWIQWRETADDNEKEKLSKLQRGRV